VTKRLLIRGDGALGETRIDQRANCPAFRVGRSCAIQNLDIDMTGFREALKVEGSQDVQPLIHQCIIRYRQVPLDLVHIVLLTHTLCDVQH